jgi:hypothetical protein
LPLILHARPTPAGERVWIWLRPGLSLADLEGRIDKLAVACWASEVRVARASRSRAAAIRVDITRRNPLAEDVDSPLPVLVPDGILPADAPVSPGMPPVGINLADIPDEPPAATKPADTKRKQRPGAESGTAPAGPPGDDLDAYI